MSTTPKHTPGPWTLLGPRFAGWDVYALAPAPRKQQDTRIASVDAAGNAVETEANARLIAAAPELLVALQRMVRATENAGLDATRNEAIAAIAKAEDK